jgi:hypothetical protein
LKTIGTLILFIISQLFLTDCSRDDEPEIDRECHMDISILDFSFGIDYNDTSRYLIPGEQSDLNDTFRDEIQDAIGIPENNITYIRDLCNWIRQNFTFENAGGSMIGIPTVDELYESKTFYGCHSEALLISSILRKFGFPALMIETFDVKWAYDYHAGTSDNFMGHVMSEILVGGKWILLDNDGTYVEEYDKYDPFISTRHPSRGLFVFAKGLDTWDYTGKDLSFTHEKLVFYSDNIYCFEEMFNTVDYLWKP